MKKNLLISVWFTLLTTVMFGLVYPLAITGLAQVLFHERANERDNSSRKMESSLARESLDRHSLALGYFHSRPSAAGTGYDPTSSGGSNLAPTNKNLLERVKGDVQKIQAENPNAPIQSTW